MGTVRGHPFVQGMPLPLVKKLASLAHEVEFEQDEIVFQSSEEQNENPSDFEAQNVVDVISGARTRLEELKDQNRSGAM